MSDERATDHPIKPLLCVRLRMERTRRGLTQAALAKILGVNRFTVCRWERGALGIHPLRMAAVERWIAGE